MSLTKVTPDVVEIASLSQAIKADQSANGLKTFVDTQLLGKTNYADLNALKIYDIASGCLGKPKNGAVIFRFITPRAFTLPAGLVGSKASASVASAANQSFDIRKNGISIGSKNWLASNTTGSFVFNAAVTFAAGDVLSIHAPATADANLADFNFVLSGTLV